MRATLMYGAGDVGVEEVLLDGHRGGYRLATTMCHTRRYGAWAATRGVSVT